METFEGRAWGGSPRWHSEYPSDVEINTAWFLPGVPTTNPILATTEQYNILQERKIIPAERICFLQERAGALAETKIILQDRFLFPAEPLRPPRGSKFVLTEYYNDLKE